VSPVAVRTSLLLAIVGAAMSASAWSMLASLSAQRGATVSTLTLGAEQSVLPAGRYGLRWVPDEHMTYLRLPDGSARVFWGGGTTAGPGRTIAMSTRDFRTFEPLVRSSDLAVGVLSPSGPGGAAFDADYAGAGSVIRASNGRDLLMFYHAENHLFAGVRYPFEPFYASIGLARSPDLGMTWYRAGQIIASSTPHPPGASPREALGTGNPCAIVFRGYIYLFYLDIAPPHTRPDVIHVARAPQASDGVPGSWQKFYEGAFAEPGLGGRSTPVAGRPAPAERTMSSAFPDVSYNTYLKSFLMAFQTNDGFYYATSPDLVNWTMRGRFFAFPAGEDHMSKGQTFYSYPTLISPEQPNDQLTARTGYLFYARGAYQVSAHGMYRRAFSLEMPGAKSSIR
jgi:hypothetical protein